MPSNEVRVLFPFWLKLTLFSISLTSIILVGGFYFIYQEMRKTTIEELVSDLKSTDNVRKLIESKRKAHFTEIANEMKYNSILVSFIRESASTTEDDLFGIPDEAETKKQLKESSEKILSTLKNNYKIYDSSDVFILVNRNGEVLLNKNNTNKLGEDISHWTPVQNIIKGKDHCSSLWMGDSWVDYLPEQSKDKLFLVTAVPLKDQQGIYGVMLKGLELGNEYFNQFQFDQESKSYISFIKANKVLSSQFEPSKFSHLENSLEDYFSNSSKSENDFHRINFESHEYLLSISNFENIDSQGSQIILMKDFTEPFNKKLSNFLSIIINLILIASIIALLLSLIISKFLTSSIIALTEGVRKIGQGDFDARVHVTSKDELSLLANSFNKMGEDLKTGEFLEGAMKKYISSDLVDDLKEKQHLIELGGENQKLSIYFSDIVAFTPLAEKLSPEQLIEWLNQYMSTMANIIEDNQGTIDKFIGDAIMAFWNAPRTIENHCDHAANAALNQIRFLNSDEPLKWSPSIKQKASCRIGLHYGNAIVGNVGSENRISYTAIGDDINLASRLEGANRTYGTNILISENFHKQLKDDYICKPLDKIIVKGKTKPVVVYELIETKSNCDPKLINETERFKEILNLYWNQEFKDALKLIHELDSNAQLIQLYEERCKNFQNNPPPGAWEGETLMDYK